MEKIELDGTECCEKCNSIVVIWKDSKGKRFLDFHYKVYPEVCKGKVRQ